MLPFLTFLFMLKHFELGSSKIILLLFNLTNLCSLLLFKGKKHTCPQLSLQDRKREGSCHKLLGWTGCKQES